MDCVHPDSDSKSWGECEKADDCVLFQNANGNQKIVFRTRLHKICGAGNAEIHIDNYYEDNSWISPWKKLEGKGVAEESNSLNPVAPNPGSTP
jgi:hypothetical protein